MFSLGFTGPATGMSCNQQHLLGELIRLLLPQEIHLGDCVGADSEAWYIAYMRNVRTIGHPPEDRKKRAFRKYTWQFPPAPYRVRDEAIVKYSTLLMAAPNSLTEVLRSGTWMTIRIARRSGVPTVLLHREEPKVRYQGQDYAITDPQLHALLRALS